jgi:hypothetical protein
VCQCGERQSIDLNVTLSCSEFEVKSSMGKCWYSQCSDLQSCAGDSKDGRVGISRRRRFPGRSLALLLLLLHCFYTTSQGPTPYPSPSMTMKLYLPWPCDLADIPVYFILLAFVFLAQHKRAHCTGSTVGIRERESK